MENEKTPAQLTQEIEAMIHSATSPVGIDAKKTHVIIIQKLIAIEQRLARIEANQQKDQ